MLSNLVNIWISAKKARPFLILPDYVVIFILIHMSITERFDERNKGRFISSSKS